MIVLSYHNDAHLGTEWVLSKIWCKFWIVNARKLVKKIKRQCVTCKRLYATPLGQRMADFPPERCQPGETPFTYVGLDLFGPFYVRLGRSTVKRYGCVFTCFTTREIHLEKLDSLETDTFVNGFVRFVAHRGYSAKLWSDNGTNLVGAQTELAKALRQLDRGKVVATARRHNVEWTFNPPLASHHGGVWERMIHTIRKVLLAVLNTATRLSDDVLHTVLCEVEGVMNSRPITKCSDDIDDEGALTPNHFLMLKGNFPLPWGRWGYV